ncbi:hypothetical protein QFZ82_007486 [Streptomyces sp. V4I23]|nr:hypothetical protein [Streptomyces sp. V4I23]
MATLGNRVPHQLGRFDPGVDLLRCGVIGQFDAEGVHAAIQARVNVEPEARLPQGADQLDAGHRPGVVQPVAGCGAGHGRHRSFVGPEAQGAHRKSGAVREPAESEQVGAFVVPGRDPGPSSRWRLERPGATGGRWRPAGARSGTSDVCGGGYASGRPPQRVEEPICRQRPPMSSSSFCGTTTGWRSSSAPCAAPKPIAPPLCASSRRTSAGRAAARRSRHRQKPAHQAGHRQWRSLQRRRVRPLHRYPPRVAAHPHPGQEPRPERRTRARLRLAEVGHLYRLEIEDLTMLAPGGRALPACVQPHPTPRDPVRPPADRGLQRPEPASPTFKPRSLSQKLDARQSNRICAGPPARCRSSSHRRRRGARPARPRHQVPGTPPAARSSGTRPPNSTGFSRTRAA